MQVLVAHILMKAQGVSVEVNNVMLWFDIKLIKHSWIITVFMENTKKVSLTAFLLVVLSKGNLNKSILKMASSIVISIGTRTFCNSNFRNI